MKIGDAGGIVDKGPNMTNFDDNNELENIYFDVWVDFRESNLGY